MTKEELVQIAIDARARSYSPYSHFAVGAALLCNDGSIYIGANVENAAYPLCMCAERNAIYNAYMNGYKKDDFVSLTLIADTDKPCTPCGACRQVLAELFPENAPINMANLKGEVLTMTIKELLPLSFSSEDLK